MPVRFVEGNINDAPAPLNDQYDIAFVTWGSLIWLPDIRRWTQIVAELLAPDGWLYLAKGHPLTMSLNEVDGRLVAIQSRRTPMAAPFVQDDVMTYTGDATPLAHTRSYEWCHPLCDIIGSLLNAGLHLDFLHEREDWGYRLPNGHPPMPLSVFAEGYEKIVRETHDR